MSGPYVSPDDSRVYFKRDEHTLNGARHEAAGHAAETIGHWGRARYLGKQAVPLHDHDDWEECDACPEWAVWTFETYEGTYR